jgi:hypothetical protein
MFLVPRPGLLWAVTALPIFMGYGLAIPNILSPALHDYRESLARAGALFGLTYYALIGLALTASSAIPFGSPLYLSLCWLVVIGVLIVIDFNSAGCGATIRMKSARQAG